MRIPVITSVVLAVLLVCAAGAAAQDLGRGLKACSASVRRRQRTLAPPKPNGLERARLRPGDTEGEAEPAGYEDHQSTVRQVEPEAADVLEYQAPL
jgi:hypothetical protein